jgi:L-2-hydroxyglutarate oxidase
MSKKIYDFAVLGGGLYGMNIAKGLLNKFKNCNVLLLEKEKELVNLENHLLVLNNNELMVNQNLKKYKYIKEGFIKLKQFCDENKIATLEKQNFMLARNKKEILAFEKRLADNKSIDFESVKENEPLIYDKCKDKFFYDLGMKQLVDLKLLKNCLAKSIESKIDIQLRANVDSVEYSAEQGVYKIAAKRSRLTVKNKSDEFSAKFIVNTCGNDALRISKQITSEFNRFKQFNYTHSYYKLPNKRPINNLLSSPQSDFYPGLILYQDTDGYPIIGPVVNLSAQEGNSGFLNKLKQLKNYIKFLTALVQTSENYDSEIYYNHPYRAKSFYSPFLELYYVIGTEKLYNSQVHSILIKDKRIFNDVILFKEKNSVHLLNTNTDDMGLTMCLPICEEILNNINI